MSKVKTLQTAIDYINNLESLLRQTEEYRDVDIYVSLVAVRGVILVVILVVFAGVGISLPARTSSDEHHRRVRG